MRGAVCVCVCVLRVDGTWHVDGARVGDAQQTRRGHALRPRAVEYTQIRRPVLCVLRVDGTWHADGARVGDAQQTRGPRAVEYRQIKRPAPARVCAGHRAVYLYTTKITAVDLYTTAVRSEQASSQLKAGFPTHVTTALCRTR
jgi:hypothetical protein